MSPREPDPLVEPRTPHLGLFPPLVRRLDVDDDPRLWDAVLGSVLREIEARWKAEAPSVRRVHVGLFKVPRWLRPNQRRWTVDGPGFAAPETYTNHPDQNARWGLWLLRSKNDTDWSCRDTGEPGRRKKGEFVLRLSVPGHSMRHRQAAVAGEWRPTTPWLGAKETEGGFVWYGFRRTDDAWVLTGHEESTSRE